MHVTLPAYQFFCLPWSGIFQKLMLKISIQREPKAVAFVVLLFSEVRLVAWRIDVVAVAVLWKFGERSDHSQAHGYSIGIQSGSLPAMDPNSNERFMKTLLASWV